MENPAIKKYADLSEQDAIAEIIKNDDVIALRYLVDNDYINSSNFDKTYFIPAVKAKAFKCLNILREFENYMF